MQPQILIDGLGDVASEVIYGNDLTKLKISAGPSASISNMVLRNIGGATSSFITGKRVTVGLGGTVLWAGYVMHAARQFWFDVDKSNTMNRRWALTLVDLNVLFGKRVVFKQSAPGTVYGPTYKTDVYDDTLVNLLTSSWLDLSDDDLDISSLIERVAVVNPSVTCADGQAFMPWSGGNLWGDAMDSISQVPAAIYGLIPAEPLGSSPFGRFFYADVDSEDAPMALSDRPQADGAGSYRECTIWDDGTDLVNEEFAWGAGKGSAAMVFSHRTDSGSISDHGLWQRGDTLFNVWCQDTIDAISNAVVNGSPSSRRGHKNSITSVELTTRETGLRVGQKVRFINHEYGVDTILPIRSTEITFPSPDEIKTAMTLSEALDRWGFEDPQPPFTIPSPGGGGVGGGSTGGAGACPCGTTDMFDRVFSLTTLTTTGGYVFGTSDSGLDWFAVGQWRLHAPEVSADGTRAVLTFKDASTPSTPGSQINLSLVSPEVPWVNQIHSFQFTLDSLGRSYKDILLLRTGFHPLTIVINPRTDLMTASGIWLTPDVTLVQAIPPSFWQAGVI
jgi:hypothetical protein